MVQIPTGNRQFYDTTTKQSSVGTYAQALRAPASAIGEEIDHIQHVKIMSQMADAKQKIGIKLEELKNQYENDPENEGFNKALSEYTKSVYSEMRGKINPIYRGVFDRQAETLNKSINSQNEFWKFKQQGVNLQNDMQKIGESLLLDAYENGQNMDYQSAIDNFENNMSAIIPAANKYLGSEKTEKAIERMREAYLYQFAQGAIENNPDQAEALLNNEDFRKQAGAENVMKLKNVLKNYKAKLYKQQQTQALRNAKNSMKALKELQKQAIRDERKRMKEIEKERREQIKEQKREEAYRKKEGLELGKEVLADLRDKRNFLDELEKEEEIQRKYEKVEDASNMLAELSAKYEEDGLSEQKEETAQTEKKEKKATASKDEIAIQKQKKYDDWKAFYEENRRAPNKEEEDFYKAYGYYPDEFQQQYKERFGHYASDSDVAGILTYGRLPTEEEYSFYEKNKYFGNEKEIDLFLNKIKEEDMQKELDDFEFAETKQDAKYLITNEIISSLEYSQDKADTGLYVQDIALAMQKILKQAEVYGGTLNADEVREYQEKVLALWEDREKARLLPEIKNIKALHFDGINEIEEEEKGFFYFDFLHPDSTKRVDKESPLWLFGKDDLYINKYREAKKILHDATIDALNNLINGDNVEKAFITARKKINKVLYPEIEKVGQHIFLNGIEYVVVDIPLLDEPKLKKVNKEGN